MIRLSNGHQFEYMAASGALAFDGRGWLWERPLRWLGFFDPTLFTVVIKTLTFKPRKGNLRWYNPFRCVKFIKDGVVNSVGLTNKGYEWWCEKVGPYLPRKISLVGSIFAEDPSEVFKMALALNHFDLVALELNSSCPNTGGGVIENTKTIINCRKAAREVTRFPLILKVSVVHTVDVIIPAVEGIIEAISINSVPWNIIFPDKKSPLVHLGGGGVSGKAASPYTWNLVDKLASEYPIPVIGPGIWDFGDIEKLRELGAEAIGFGSVFLRYPWKPTLFVRRDQKSTERRGGDESKGPYHCSS